MGGGGGGGHEFFGNCKIILTNCRIKHVEKCKERKLRTVYTISLFRAINCLKFLALHFRS